MTIPTITLSRGMHLAPALSLLHDVRSALQLLQNELLIVTAHAPKGEGQLAQSRCRWLGEVVTGVEEIVELISSGGIMELERFLDKHLRSALGLERNSITKSVTNENYLLHFRFTAEVSGARNHSSAHSCTDFVGSLRSEKSSSSKMIDLSVQLLKGESTYNFTQDMHVNIAYMIPICSLKGT